MSIERKSEYYDEIYNSSEAYQGSHLESPYLAMWQFILTKIPTDINIIELGCGTGQFAELLRENNFERYVGVDFSEKAVEICIKRKLGYTFKIIDLNKFNWEETHGLFVCMETFEHLKDFKLIDNIGLGKEIIFTVPDFNDASHVRYFHSVNEVVDRYKNVLKFEFILKFERWFVCKAVTI